VDKNQNGKNDIIFNSMDTIEDHSNSFQTSIDRNNQIKKLSTFNSRAKSADKKKNYALSDDVSIRNNISVDPSE
jgi:hypothetical protein